MYRIQRADMTYGEKIYPDEASARRALYRLKEEDSAVVWFNDAGVPKVWAAYFLNGRVDQVGSAARAGRRTAP